MATAKVDKQVVETVKGVTLTLTADEAKTLRAVMGGLATEAFLEAVKLSDYNQLVDIRHRPLITAIYDALSREIDPIYVPWRR